MVRFKGWPPSFNLAQSRWGGLAIILPISISMLLLGVTMLPLSPSCASILTIVFLTIGGIGIAFSFIIALYWIFKGPKEQSIQEIGEKWDKNLDRKLERLEKHLDKRLERIENGLARAQQKDVPQEE